MEDNSVFHVVHANQLCLHLQSICSASKILQLKTELLFVNLECKCYIVIFNSHLS